MNLKKLELITLIDKYSSGDLLKDVENLVTHGSACELIEAIQELAILAYDKSDFKIHYPDSEVLK